MQKWWNGLGFQNLPLSKFVKNGQRIYSNMSFLKDYQTGIALAKMRIMMHWCEGKSNGSLGENNDFKANTCRSSERIHKWQLGEVFYENESKFPFIWPARKEKKKQMWICDFCGKFQTLSEKRVLELRKGWKQVATHLIQLRINTGAGDDQSSFENYLIKVMLWPFLPQLKATEVFLWWAHFR